MDRPKWKVVITDCDHGGIEEEKKVFDRVGAELVWAQAKEEEELIRVCKDGGWAPEPVCPDDPESSRKSSQM